MHDKRVLGGGAGTALETLPYIGRSLTWVVLARFALLMAASAVWRIVPRSQA
jgi:hypothetical protein